MYLLIVDSAVDRTISSQVPLSQLFRNLQAHRSIYQPVKMLHVRKYMKNIDNVRKKSLKASRLHELYFLLNETLYILIYVTTHYIQTM